MASTVVRELLVSLGFKVNRSDIRKVDQNINNVKRNLNLLYSSSLYMYSQIGRLIARVVSFGSDLFTNYLDTKEFSNSIGLAVREVEALESAFSDFRFSQSDVRSLFQSMQKDINDFRIGVGKLPEVLMSTGIEFSPDEGVLGLFSKYIEYIQKFEEYEKDGIIGALFPQSNVERIKEISNSFDTLRGSAKSYYDILEDSPDLEEKAKDFQKNIKELEDSWKNLSRVIVSDVYPVISGIVDYINQAIQGWSYILGGKLREDLQRSLGLLETWEEKDMRFYSGIDFEPLSNSSTNIVNNDININFSDSSVDDPRSFAENIAEKVEESVLRSFKEIQYDNPALE